MISLLPAVAGLASLVSFALAQSGGTPTPVAAPGNSTSYVPPSNSNDAPVLLTNMTNAGARPPSVIPLTQQANDIIPTGSSVATGIGASLVAIGPNNSGNASSQPQPIAYISCDADAYTGNIDLNTVVSNVIRSNATAILFYSTQSKYCNLTGPPVNGFQALYSMTDPATSAAYLTVLNQMSGGTVPQAVILTQLAWTNVINKQNNTINGASPSTAVAMIILYSITGVITALFLVIIVTGAVRAHRHPERYGPRNIMGRPRQSRARGIARAMLDTIPIVKFGDNREEPKTNDVELAANPGGTNPAGAKEQSRQTTSETPVAEGEEGSNSNIDSHQHRDANQGSGEDEGLSCSICTEDFEQGQDIRVLPCDHKFHPTCVDPWLLDVSGTCPLCRVDLRPPEQREGTEEGDHISANADDVTGLPPPLNQSATGNNTRRRNIRSFFDLRRLQGSTREERISALRQYRQATRRQREEAMMGGAEAETGDGQQDPHEDPVSRLARVRRSIFRGHA